MKIDKYEYQKGKDGVKYGIYNSVTKKFQFNICEDTPMLAEARLFQLIGDDAYKWRFKVKPISVNKSKLTALKDYYFKRDDFEKVWSEVFTKEELGLVLSEGHLVTDNFLYEQIGDEHYLIHLESGTIINWYKHLGRTNTCNKNDFTLNDLKTMIQLYADDYREEVLEPKKASKTSNSNGPDVQSMYPRDVICAYANSIYGMTLKPFKKEDNSED